MDFTREPIIETIITPKEGCKLAIRSSKAANQEEYFVSAVEVVSFGSALFYRSLERPKSFLVPVSDYEVMEVRETRMVLKTVGLGKAKAKEGKKEAKEKDKDSGSNAKAEPKAEKKRQRRKSERRRRVQEEREAGQEVSGEDGESADTAKQEKEKTAEPVAEAPAKKERKAKEKATEAEAASEPTPAKDTGAEESVDEGTETPPPTLALQPPSQLISETLDRYRDNEIYRGAFFSQEKSEDEAAAMDDEPAVVETEAEPETEPDEVSVLEVDTETEEQPSVTVSESTAEGKPNAE